MSSSTPIATLQELKNSRVLLRQWGEKMVALFIADGEIFAIEDLCPHRAGPLSEGKLVGKTISCPWHEAKFDLVTGQPLEGPTSKPLKKLVVKIESEEIFVV